MTTANLAAHWAKVKEANAEAIKTRRRLRGIVLASVNCANNGASGPYDEETALNSSQGVSAKLKELEIFARASGDDDRLKKIAKLRPEFEEAVEAIALARNKATQAETEFRQACAREADRIGAVLRRKRDALFEEIVETLKPYEPDRRDAERAAMVCSEPKNIFRRACDFELLARQIRNGDFELKDLIGKLEAEKEKTEAAVAIGE